MEARFVHGQSLPSAAMITSIPKLANVLAKAYNLITGMPGYFKNFIPT